ncbi:MAG: hypothetical protein M0Q15_04475 [Nevskia sp.]|jgi:hypothetical protein|nr:hypothetical protein [Nevskia sp.]
MKILIAFLAGSVFSVGLMLSRMIDPARVVGFLDVAGHWDPALVFVMGGAILAAAPLFAWARARGKDIFGRPITLPARSGIDRRLLGGATLFGLGWGLSGICPGPVLVLLGTGDRGAAVFAVTMLIGIGLSRLTPAKRLAITQINASAAQPAVKS